jgi:hypothetical protein
MSRALAQPAVGLHGSRPEPGNHLTRVAALEPAPELSNR